MKSTALIRDWPLLCLVAVLFFLSVRAPRQWRRVAVIPVHRLMANLAADDRWTPPPGLEKEGLPLMAGATLAQQPVAEGELEGVLRPRRVAVERSARHNGETSRTSMEPAPDGDGSSSSTAPSWPSSGDSEVAPEDPLKDFVIDPRVAEIEAVVANRYADAERLGTVAPPQQEPAGDDLLLPSAVARIASRSRQPVSPDAAPALVRSHASGSSVERIANWPRCPLLAERLKTLEEFSAAAGWCRAVQGELDALSQFDTLSADAVTEALENLQRLADEARSRAAGLQSTSQRNQWGRCVHGLDRRLSIWRDIHEIAAARAVPVSISMGDFTRLLPVLESVEDKLQVVKHGDAWRNYLLVEQAQQLGDRDAAFDTAAARELARQILRRMEYSRLTPTQREFLQQAQFLAYAQELKHLAADPVDYFQLLQDLEDYEFQPTAERSARIAAAQQALRWSHDEAVARLGQKLDGRYRNANVRLAVSRHLINRLMPPAAPTRVPVDETILGVRNRGCSQSLTRLTVHLLPSPDSWHLYLQADGHVDSATLAAQGPARFFTRGTARFMAEKQILIQPDGVSQPSAEVSAESRTGLAGLETDIDAVPILSDIVQAIATYQYRRRAPDAEWEAKNRLAWRIGETIDENVREQVEQIERRFVEHVHQPMEQLGLNPLPLRMETTDLRLIARYRLAGYHQLAAYTPRPLAPGNSLLSLQIHESAVNNVIEQFGWSGKRVKLHQVYQELADLFAWPNLKAPEDLPDDVTIRFADRNPLRVSFQEGRATVTLGLAELSQGRKRWRNFVVRVHYQPAPDDPHADLVREQYVELIGRLAFGDQIALRGVFSRVFSRDKPFALVSRRLAEDPRLQGLELSQLEIADGWLALAIGPSGTRLDLQLREARHASDNLLVR